MASEFLLSDRFSPLSDIVKSYKDARQQSYLDQFAEKLASGDADYQSLASLAAKGGQFGLAMPLLQQAEQRKAAASVGPLISDVLGGQSSVQQAPPAAQSPPGVMPPASPAPGGAVSSIESGGRYDALGPPHPKTGDRAYGKYQVMGENIPQWTQQVIGRRMTPQEFVASPQAQEAVFKAKFGEYTAKYGPEGAARAWFAGESGMNDPNRKDVLGTSVADYSRKFMAAGGGGPQVMDVDGASRPDANGVYRGDAVMMPQQTAQAGDVTTPPNAAPAQGFAVPGQQQSSGQFPPGAIKILTALQNPNLPEGARKSLELVLQRILPENKFTPIGEDMLGNKRFGFVDPNKQSVTGIDGKPVSSQGGSTAGNMPVGPDGNPLQGPELLEHLKKTDPVAAAGVRGIMEGDINAAGRNLQKLLPLAKLVDPSLQQFDYASRAKTRTDFTSGPSSREIKAINTAIYHAGELSKVSDELGGVNVAPGVINPLIQGYRRNTGDVAYQTARKGWDSTSETLATEIAKALNGGQPHVADKEAWRKVFAAANSPAEREAAVSSAMKLLEGRTHALSATYERGLGRTRDAMTFIDEPNKKAFEQLMATGKVSAPSKTQPAPTGKTNKTSTGVTWSVE